METKKKNVRKGRINPRHAALIKKYGRPKGGEKELLNGFGMWEDRNISAKELREKAWSQE